MVSLIRFLYGLLIAYVLKPIFGQQEWFRRLLIIKFWRISQYKVLRIHLLGLTLAFVFVLYYQGTGYLPADIQEASYQSSDVQHLSATDTGRQLVGILLTLLWFALVTRYFGIWAWLTVLLYILNFDYLCEIGFCTSTLWYLAGYLSGAVTAMLYNDLLFLYVHWSRRKQCRLLYAYDPGEPFNIIKAPAFSDENAFVSSRLTREKRLYDFNIEGVDKPYTIALMASPYIKKNENTVRDSIIKNRDLFLRTVGEALQVFAASEVLGRPEIWSKVRVITIFEKNPAQSTSSPIAYVETDNTFDGIVTPGDEIDGALKSQVNSYNQVPFDEIDVFYFFTAEAEFLRSSAHFAKEKLVTSFATEASFTGEPKKPVDLEDDEGPSPGKVALNVLGARRKTFIHEFAHAMSAYNTGAIVDEYFHEGIITDGPAPEMFMINRNTNGAPGAEIPTEFAKFPDKIYWTDREHPSLEEDWTAYFPDRFSKDLPCTMDRTYGVFHFDRLICDFMYERIKNRIP